MEITYRKCGDYYIPNIALPEQPKAPLGKYGRMRKQYLKEHRPILWERMILNGTLFSHLHETDRICEERMEALITAMADRRGVTEQLKARDQLRWVGEMNNIRACAEEIVLSEMVYV